MSRETKEPAPKAMFKIEGEGFEKVKVAREKLRAIQKESERDIEAAHKQLWDAIHDAIPEADRKVNLSLDTSCESLGLYVVKGTEDCCDGLLKAILGSMKTKAA